MTATQIFGVASVILGIFSAIPYIRAVISGRTVPHQLSWLIFTIMNGMALFAQVFSGGLLSIGVTAVFFAGSATVLVMSLFKGTRDTSRFDRGLFVFAVIAMIIWALTRNNNTAIWLTLLIDIAATAMTVLKVKAQPQSESPTPWAIGAVAYMFSCLTLIGVPLGILYVRPLYGFASELAVVLAIWYWARRRFTV